MSTWRKVGCCLFAAVAAVGAFAGEFLEGLADRTDRVDSSPYATGGDIILRISGEHNDYVHIFTNVSPSGAYAFVPAQDLETRFLLIAGGGGGGSGYFSHGGGGGAGGFVETNGCVLSSGVEYAVKIGGGGAGTSGNDRKTGSTGGDSTFAGLVAKGGGGGGGFFVNQNETVNAGKAGGSGGGGGGTSVLPGYGGVGIEGQGYSGADGLAFGVTGSGGAGGGGGGAGGPGHKSVDEHSRAPKPGDGGIGRISNVLGFDQYFAGGGASGSHGLQGNGGLGGGGNGNSSSQTNADPGEDGLGGGGGGAACTGSQASGRGGTGFLAVRYSVNGVSSISCEDAILEFKPDRSVDATLSFVNRAISGQAVSADVEVWPTDDESKKSVYSFGSDIPTTNLWKCTLLQNLTGLLAGTAYSFKFTVTNADGESDTLVRSLTIPGYTCDPVITGVEESDYVWKHEFDDSDEIYIFTNTSKTAIFTPQSDGYVRLLLVGGGAAGYSATLHKGTGGGGGGGGAGGVVYNGAYFVKAGVPYEIKVGAGSTVPGDVWAPPGNGKNSSFGELVAYGGGQGGGNNQTQYYAKDGGCGGGGADAIAGGGSPYGQGYYGGNCVNSIAGGGGGAGSPGLTASSDAAGKGGDGVTYDISGEIVTYGGGGGGGASDTYNGGAAGLGGGGKGGGADGVATSGVDGLGGGGGGGNMGLGSKTSRAGRGGSGVVIVRYTDMSKMSDDPKFTAVYQNITADSIDVEVDVSYYGKSGSSAQVRIEWGYAEDNLEFSKTLAAAHVAKTVYTLDGLGAGRDYFARVTVVGEGGGRTVGVVYPFTTRKAMAEKATVTHEAFVYSFAFDVSAVDADAVSTVAELWTSTDAGALALASTLAISEPGRYALLYGYPAQTRGQQYYFVVKIRETDAQGREFVQSTTQEVMLMDDNSDYTFSAADGVGYWTNSMTWTCSYGDKGAGYPVSTLSTVHFPNNSSCEVLLTESVRPNRIFFTMTGSTVVLRGVEDDLSVQMVQGVGDYFVGLNSTIVFDHVAALLDHGGGWPKFSVNQGMELRNGASYTYANGVEMQYNTGTRLSVTGGSRFAIGNALWGNGTSRFVLDDATISCTQFVPARNGSGNASVTIAGAAPQLSCGSFTCDSAPATVLFDIPETPWAAAPVQVSGKFSGGAYPIAVTLPAKADLKCRRFARSCDIPLVQAEGGIAQDSVTFGANPLESRMGSGFRYSDDGKTLYYHYVSPRGLVLFVK